MNYEKFLRAQAELDTARRRWRQELEEIRKYQALPIVKDLLPGLDNLRRAVDAANAGSTVESLRTGVEMVLKQIDDVFANTSPSAVGRLEVVNQGTTVHIRGNVTSFMLGIVTASLSL